MNADAGPLASLSVALERAEQLIARAPSLAVQQSQEILRVVPHEPRALLLLGRAQWAAGQTNLAQATLSDLTRRTPGDGAAWQVLADLLRATDQVAAADAAYLNALRAGTTDPDLIEAALALCDQRLAEAEGLLRARLKVRPTDVAALRMLAEVAARLGRYPDVLILLERCLELSPGFEAARRSYALVLQRQDRLEEALAQVDLLMASKPGDAGYSTLKAAIAVKLGDYGEAAMLYEQALRAQPQQPKGWMSYGHALKTLGRRDDSIAAYRRALDQAPSLGEAWWSLANLKTFAFSNDDIAVMSHQLRQPGLAEEDSLHLHYALGKALEDRQAFDQAFAHYAAGATIRRGQIDYQAQDTTDQVERTAALLNRGFFAGRSGGCDAPDPIFVVGLPRSGSTLVEQILASHSQIEGTMELPDLMAMARRLGDHRGQSADSAYPETLSNLSSQTLRSLGEEYLERTRIQRKTDRPLFIDKMPNNWAHVGLIHLILPKAKIIDARRHPMGCCFSAFKQHFARGQGFSYDLNDLGRYYRDYVGLMSHFDAVLPGRIHRVIYEQMIADTPVEVARLLDYVGVPFEETCLSFWNNDRAVRTASSEQVRQPIFTDGVDHWRRFEPWLGPLKSALGTVLQAYPQAPRG